MNNEAQGVWVGPDGSARPVRMKGGRLFDAFFDHRGGSENDLGSSKTDMALGYATAVWAYRCIKLRADAVAGVPLVLLDRHGAPIEDHALLTLLRDVNPTTMNLGDLLRATEAAYNIWGVAYWLKVKEGSGGRDGQSVRWLQWLNPQTVEIVKDPARGIVAYKQTSGKETREYAPEDVIAFRNFDPLDDLGGLSPLSVVLNEINAELNASRFVNAFFANDARPAGLLTTEHAVHESDQERILTWWQSMFKGPGNKWKTGIIGQGFRWQRITFPMHELALPELRAEDRRAICAVFGVPSGMAGAWEATTYASAREQKASFYEDTILPQLEYYAEVLNWSLLPHYPDLLARDARIAWDSDSIAALRETATDKAQRLAHLFEVGLVTRNEVRGELGMALLDESEDGFVAEIAAESAEQESETDSASTPEEQPRVLTQAEKVKALRGELKRWERFVVRRVKDEKPLRHFKSAIIPTDLWQRISTGLESVHTLEDVYEVFGEALLDIDLAETQHMESNGNANG